MLPSPYLTCWPGPRLIPALRLGLSVAPLPTSLGSSSRWRTIPRSPHSAPPRYVSQASHGIIKSFGYSPLQAGCLSPTGTIIFFFLKRCLTFGRLLNKCLDILIFNTEDFQRCLQSWVIRSWITPRTKSHHTHVLPGSRPCFCSLYT